jgi:hypothetical protein
MPRKPRPAVETYEHVSRERKSALRREVRGQLSAAQERLMALAADDAERAIVAQEYLQQHTAGSKVGETVMGTWSDLRLRALKALKARGLKPADLAGHLGLTLTRIGQILAPSTGRSRQAANASAAVRRAPEGGPVGRPVASSTDSEPEGGQA